MTNEIDDLVLKVADCEAGAEDKTARAVKHKYHAAPEGQQYDLGLNDERSRRPVFKKSAPFFFWFTATISVGMLVLVAGQQKPTEHPLKTICKNRLHAGPIHNSAKPQGSLRPYF